jgi:hypothetical protein
MATDYEAVGRARREQGRNAALSRQAAAAKRQATAWERIADALESIAASLAAGSSVVPQSEMEK